MNKSAYLFDPCALFNMPKQLHTLSLSFCANSNLHFKANGMSSLNGKNAQMVSSEAATFSNWKAKKRVAVSDDCDQISRKVATLAKI